MVKDCTARSFINAAGLHAHKTVLNNIRKADAVFPTQLIQLRNHIDRAQLIAVERYRNSFFELKCNVGCLVGRLFR